jgi:hypothetical protein
VVDFTQARLEVTGSVTLNGSGAGTVRLAPAGESWLITNMSVKTNQTSVTNEARAQAYRRQVLDSTLIDSGTYSGSSGDTSDTQFLLTDGEPVFIVWTGGDAGVVATVTLQGFKSTPQGGFRAELR